MFNILLTSWQRSERKFSSVRTKSFISIGSKPEQLPNDRQFPPCQVFDTQMTVIVPSSG